MITNDKQNKYKVQYLVYRIKSKSDSLSSSSLNQLIKNFLKSKQILLFSEKQCKYFNNLNFTDTYIYFIQGKDLSYFLKVKRQQYQKITALIQKLQLDDEDLTITDSTSSNPYGESLKPQNTANLIQNLKKQNKNQRKFPQYCCQVQTILSFTKTSKKSLDSQFKFLFEESDKNIQKIKQFYGHKLRDLVSYPESLKKQINSEISDYILSKKNQKSEDQNQQSESQSNSSDSGSSDSDRSSGSESSNSSSQSQDSKSERRRRKKSKSHALKQKKEKYKNQNRDKDKSKQKERRRDKKDERQKGDKNKQKRSKDRGDKKYGQKQRQKDKKHGKQKNYKDEEKDKRQRQKRSRSRSKKNKEHQKQKDEKKSYTKYQKQDYKKVEKKQSNQKRSNSKSTDRFNKEKSKQQNIKQKNTQGKLDEQAKKRLREQRTLQIQKSKKPPLQITIVNKEQDKVQAKQQVKPIVSKPEPILVIVQKNTEVKQQKKQFEIESILNKKKRPIEERFSDLRNKD